MNSIYISNCSQANAPVLIYMLIIIESNLQIQLDSMDIIIAIHGTVIVFTARTAIESCVV